MVKVCRMAHRGGMRRSVAWMPEELRHAAAGNVGARHGHTLHAGADTFLGRWVGGSTRANQGTPPSF